ncbi:anthranilate synthase component I family protein [Sphingobacterium sp. LRF_L2]|uniref:anthranilate synthase component I family protein n=1 Tax=Sphingobacterium sp. LRF_L2 TaxID=3369421 RepID=UPI003F63DB4F
MAKAIFEIDTDFFEKHALAWAQQFDEVCFFKSNNYKDEYTKLDSFLAVDAKHTFVSTNGENAFNELEIFKTKHPQSWLLGFFSYDLKRNLDGGVTPLQNTLAFPESCFFIPSVVIQFHRNKVSIEADDPAMIFQTIQHFAIPLHENLSEQQIIKKRLSKEAYLKAFNQMQTHIRRGDIYEVNLCQEFYADNVDISSLRLYQELNTISPTPFSSFFKWKNLNIICASPERFLAKRGAHLISQPIKGTAPRGKTPPEDIRIVHELVNSPKEIAENVMIVDLVRNDLTRSAVPGTVEASRTLEVHTFKQVHQLISTVTCLKSSEIGDVSAISNAFPPGSMTGAPKIKAMELCDAYEGSKRGIYAGALGYFSPDGDFDFNVVIRSLLYNQTAKSLSFHTGGAITLDADGEKEYQECLLKASAILQALNAKLC